MINFSTNDVDIFRNDRSEILYSTRGDLQKKLFLRPEASNFI